MSDPTIGGNEMQPEQAGMKRKLAWRMGFAGLMIVMLLGTLVVFDHLSAPDEPEAPAPRFTEPVPVPKKEITQPLKPAEPEPEAAKEEKKVAEPEVSAVPVEPPPRPEVTAQPAVPRAQLPAEPRAMPLSRPQSPIQQSPVLPQVVPSRPAAETENMVPAPVVRQQNVSTTGNTLGGRLFSGFALQAGVFSDPRLAEELHAKLTLNGISSTLEARVQVGPFKTREEAEAAREKMKALGIDAVMLMPSKGATRR